MRKIVLTFGIIAGLIMSVLMLISTRYVDQIGYDKALVVGYTSMVAAFLTVFAGVKSYRDNVAGGEIGFGRALAVGALITALASIFYVATWEVVYYKIWPDFGDKYAAHMVERARTSGASEAQIAETQNQADSFKAMYRNPVMVGAMTFIEPLPVGLLMTLIAAAVLRRRRPPAGAPALA